MYHEIPLHPLLLLVVILVHSSIRDVRSASFRTTLYSSSMVLFNPSISFSVFLQRSFLMSPTIRCLLFSFLASMSKREIRLGDRTCQLVYRVVQQENRTRGNPGFTRAYTVLIIDYIGRIRGPRGVAVKYSTPSRKVGGSNPAGTTSLNPVVRIMLACQTQTDII